MGDGSPNSLFPYSMTKIFRRAASVAVAAAFFAAAPTVAAQTADAPATTASPAPNDAQETAAPRRRPTRRFRARLSPTPATAARRDSIPIRTVSSRSSASESMRLSRLDNSLRDAAPRWLGIPYRWGGSTRRGIDCSAFVQQYVRENLAIELSRTTAGQRFEGLPIDQDELQSGDLVFFRRRGVRHVGVYLSDGEFIHASSSRGVTISNLDDSYWTQHYWMSRRILSEPSGRMPTPRAEARARG